MVNDLQHFNFERLDLINLVVMSGHDHLYYCPDHILQLLLQQTNTQFSFILKVQDLPA